MSTQLVYNKETVTGEEISKSHVACLLTYKFPCATTSALTNDESYCELVCVTSIQLL